MWLRVLDFMDQYMHAGELLSESIPESLKNMLLVMSTSGIFKYNDATLNSSTLWDLTWTRIHQFIPGLRTFLFPDSPSEKVLAIRTMHSVATEQVRDGVKSPVPAAAPITITPSEIVFGPPIPLPEATAGDKKAKGSVSSDAGVPLHPHPIIV